jgi:hypothetical protein
MTPGALTDYEAGVVQEIATWKAEAPGLYTLVTGRLTKPFAWALQHVIPEAAAKKAIEAAYATSDWLASPDEMLEKGGAKVLEELQHKSLELSDSLADQVATGSQAIAAVDGAVTGAGGFLLAAADVCALAVVALRAIHRTGHCYGYPLDQPGDRGRVLGVLLVVGTKSSTERLELLGRLQNFESWVLAETVEALAMEHLAQQLVELASLGAIPGIGAVIGTGTNVIFIRQVLKAARCVFQESWLRGNGKIDWIAPATK